MARPAKSVVGIAVAVVSALSLTACGGGSSEEQKSADAEQTLTVWGMGEEGKRLAEVAKDFEKDNPNITVKVTPVGWDVVGQKLKAAAAGGKLPDVLWDGFVNPKLKTAGICVQNGEAKLLNADGPGKFANARIDTNVNCAPPKRLPAITLPKKAAIDDGAVDGGIDSEPPAKPKRTRAPRSNPGIAPA